MNREPTFISPASIAWLQELLINRFGGDLRLSYLTEVKQWRVQLHGQTDEIRMPDLFSTSTFDASDLPVTLWVAESEGWTSPLHQAMPMLGARNPSVQLILKAKYGWFVGCDVLGFAFWMLNRVEEIGSKELDLHGRFAAVSSHAYKHNYLERPIVDEWLSVLVQVMERAWSNFIPKQHSFSVRVSHDVDRPSRYAFRKNLPLLRAMAGDIKKGNYLQALAAPYIRSKSGKQLHSWDPYNTFDWLMDISEANSIKSAFYFIAGRTNLQMDADYEIEHPAIRHLIRKIFARGHEIGLHPSYESYRSPALVEEAERLRRVLSEEQVRQNELGGRMHYLRWEHPTTLRLWESARMTYDSTMSYPDRAGFKAGTCYEYRAFDPLEQKPLSLWIRPLIAMEATVMSSNYMGLGTTAGAYAKFDELKEKCRLVKGSFTLLWHNSQFDTPAERDLFKSAVDTGSKRVSPAD